MEILGSHYDDVQRDIRLTLKRCRISENIGYPAVRVGFVKHVHACLSRGQIHALDGNGHIRSVFCVIVYDIVEIDVAYHVAVGENYIFVGDAVYRVVHAFQRFKPCRIKCIAVICVCGDIRRKDLDSAGASCKIPILARAEVIHK